MKRKTTIVEGEWEEVLEHAAEFKGRRVRVMVLPSNAKRCSRDSKKTVAVDEDTAAFLAEFAGCWAGDDLDECLEEANRLRAKTEW
jgi:hypothetical protein